MSAIRPVTVGNHTVTPYLAVRGAAKAPEFHANAFGAKELVRMPGPGDAVMHAERRIGDSNVMHGDEAPLLRRRVGRTRWGC